MLESTFQGALRLAVTRELHDRVALWRQPAGKILAKRGGAVEAAPVGAADLSGILKGSGIRLEIELKMPGKKRSAAQVAWGHTLHAWGAVYLCLTYRKGLSLELNVEQALLTLELALAARGESLAHHP